MFNTTFSNNRVNDLGKGTMVSIGFRSIYTMGLDKTGIIYSLSLA